MFRKLLILIIIILPGFVFAQIQEPNTIAFEYDATGNRILRHAIYLPPIGKKADSANSEYRKIPADFTVIDNIRINIFPNPTVSKINVTIESQEEENDIKYSLHSFTGQIISEGVFNNRSVEFDMEKQKSGPYILYICVNGKPKSWTIIKQ